MARILKHAVLLRKNPPLGELVSLLPGDALPDWAADMVGEHLFKDFEDSVQVARKSSAESAPKNPIPAPEPAPEPEPEIKVPSVKAAVASWRKFAAAVGVTVQKTDDRESIIAAIQEQRPDITIGEEEV